jgi:hypothetical protein
MKQSGQLDLKNMTVKDFVERVFKVPIDAPAMAPQGGPPMGAPAGPPQGISDLMGRTGGA